MRRVGAFLLVVASGCAVPQVVDPGPAHPVIEHVTAQQTLTPLPLRVQLPAQLEAQYVLVLVRTWGSTGWQAVELARDGQTWSGEVSCRQVSTVTGDTRYFFLALDRYGDAVISSGSPEFPHVATIVGELEQGARGLAGEPVPARCHDVADCPPDFPGCPAYDFLRSSCDSDSECASGTCEWDGYCAVDSPYESALIHEGTDEEQLEYAIRRAKQRFKFATRPAERRGPKRKTATNERRR